MRWRDIRGWVLGLAVLAAIFLVPKAVGLYGDYLWFVGLGYESVFVKRLLYRTASFIVAGGVALVALYASYRVAVRNIRDYTPYEPSPAPKVAVGGLALLVGLLFAGAWEVPLRYLHATDFGVTEPLHGMDAAFYVFTLPLVNLVLGYLATLIVVAGGFAVALYGYHFGLEEYEEVVGDMQRETLEFDPVSFTRRFARLAYGHGSVLVGALLLVLGLNFWINRYELVFSTRGTVFGAGATDVTVFLPLLGFLAVVGVVGGLANVANARIGNDQALYVAVGALIVFALVGNVAGVLYQSYVVEPDEFNQEREYIANEIDLTRQGFALDRIDERQFSVAPNISAREIADNPGTIDNVRLWDYRPLRTTYNELQIFRTYYNFNDVDIDRYTVDGRERQVMLSARELDFEALPPQSKSWVNRHLVYTHGYGVAMSPVNEVSAEGLPSLWIKDIPPNSTVGLDVDRPAIYYGETTDDYAIVNTETRELDYPRGDQNAYTTYDGEGGVRLSSAVRELVYAARFGSPQILLSGSVTSESRIQFDRSIHDRVRRLAPFLEYDDDPYVVVHDGELKWIYDAYTTSSQFPYSERTPFKGDRVNYVRNSVKVVVDAYSGETTFYVAEQDDPVIEAYRGIFPSLFRDLGEMPEDLRDNVRYPEDAFSVQSEQYLDYHMTDPNVFYNKEDQWRVPNEQARGNTIRMEPYYIMMTLPGEQEPEFVQILPYIPRGRENMIGWLAARSDPPNYGEFRSFQFSKQELIFGPQQIESRIDQDTEISQRITLWSQSGSNVIRGNLLAIPIADTILYVEPLFLEGEGQGALPELKRVIVAQGDRLTMQPTLETALDVLVGEAAPRPEGPGNVTAPGRAVPPEDLRELERLYREARQALRDGDFATFGDRLDAIGRRLNETREATTAPVSPGGTTAPG